MPTKSKTKGLNKKQLQHLEKRLLEERNRVMKELGYYGESFNASLQASDGDLSSYSFHMADQGTDAMEQEKAFLFASRSEEHTSELQSRSDLVCRLLLEKKKK